jgi:hypothetical protein
MLSERPSWSAGHQTGIQFLMIKKQAGLMTGAPKKGAPRGKGNLDEPGISWHNQCADTLSARVVFSVTLPNPGQRDILKVRRGMRLESIAFRL